MKLQDALRKIVRNRGVGVLRDSRLVSFLSDYEAFADFPDMRKVMAAIAEKGCGSELFRISQEGSLSKTVSYARGLAKSLQDDLCISAEYARYASDCIVFALGLAVTVREPSARSADPERRISREQNDAAGRGPASPAGGAGPDGGKGKDGNTRTTAGKEKTPESRKADEHGSSSSGKQDSGASFGEEKAPGGGGGRICPRCGAVLPDFCLFCPECGEKIAPDGNPGDGSGTEQTGGKGGERLCPRCDAVLPDSCTFCPNCGWRVAPEGNPGEGSGAEGAPGDKPFTYSEERYSYVSLCGWLSPNGRMSLGEWWIRWLFLFTFFGSFTYLYTTLTADSGPIDPFTLRFAILLSAVTLTGLSAFFLSVRRLHDLNLSGWLAFLLAVLYFWVQQDAIPVLFLLWLSFAGGTKVPNSYGPDPRA